MLQLQPLAPWPLPLLVFAGLVLLPGAGLASLALARRQVEAALFALLTLILGLAVVPGGAYLWVIATGNHLALTGLLVPAVSATLFSAWFWWRGHRVSLLATSNRVWAALLLVGAAAFLTHDPSVLHESAQRWVDAGRGNCFRLGTFQYLGLPSPLWKTTLPPLMDFWDGIMPGNLALSSLYTLLFGGAGFRLLRVTMALLLALEGYCLGRRFTGTLQGGLIGLAVFGLSPFVLMLQDTDRNVMALAFGTAVFVLLAEEQGHPVLLGALLGFTAGLGLQMLPLVWIAPAAWLVWHRTRAWPAPVGLAVAGIVVGAVWLLRIGWYDPGPVNPLHTYDLGFFQFSLQYRLGFPFYPALTHGPFNTYPTLLTLLFYLTETLGAIVVGLAVLGGQSLFKARRQVFWVVALFGALPLLVVSLMVRLIPEQLRLAINGLLPVLLFGALGIDVVVRRWRERTIQVGLAVAVSASFLVLLALAQVRVDEDPRFKEALPPPGQDPIMAYMTDEAIHRLGLGPGDHDPGSAAPAVLLGTPEQTSARLAPLSLPAVLPDYRHLHPLSRHDVSDDLRWVDLTGRH